MQDNERRDDAPVQEESPNAGRSFVERLDRSEQESFAQRLGRSAPIEGGFVARLNRSPDGAGTFVERIGGPRRRTTEFAVRVKRERNADNLFLVTGNSSGRRAWYYLLVEPKKRDEFLRRLDGKGTIELASFGKIVYSGYGESPPTDIKSKVAEEYDFE